MFDDELNFKGKVPKRVPNKLEKVLKLIMKYSQPKLYIPRDKAGKTCLKKAWYVYFYYDDPITKKRTPNNKFIRKHGINRFKTVRERRLYGRRLVEVYTDMLSNGWNPYENKLYIGDKLDFEIKETTLQEAIERAL